ncbi:helix-turn-helix domain-containing protein [Streptomyces hesseae]|uniref:Helix-turn-helix transcriptional regulator n=1 Tax=Streptomyces hesseae TaxID=3075519 RepID=A0ABU2SYD5_9ACTN|nr:helix-turn-helix transcriptional regulator [Streptomyces sp. DSM 40473]MDT0454014.1 helix-turn-helix transcriptional regulator [Streptomyces sp. DSM 40473]
MSAVPQPGEPVPAPVIAMKRDPKQAAAARMLGDQLRSLRQERGLGLKDVAHVIRGSVSKMSRLERGESPPKDRDIQDLMRHYGVSGELERTIASLVQQTRNEEWWEQYTDVTPGFLKRLISLEGSAARIYCYENHVVPGLLQTESYARALVAAAMPGAPDDIIDKLVRLRMGRQCMLKNPRPTVIALLDEGILRRPVGGPEVMTEQLAYLRRIADFDQINIRIVGFEPGAAVAPSFPITHLYFDDGGPSELVYVEHLNNATYLTRPKEIDQYRSVLNELSRVAASREGSIRILSDAIDRFGGCRS